MFKWRLCFKKALLNSKKSSQQFAFYSFSLLFSNIFKLALYMTILTNSTFCLTINHQIIFNDNRNNHNNINNNNYYYNYNYNNNNNENIEQYSKPIQQKNSEIISENSAVPISVLIHSNMGNGINVSLSVMESQIKLRMKISNKVPQDDEKFWIEKQSLLFGKNSISIRKSQSNLYICLDQNGNIIIQELKSLFVDEECLWHWKSTAFGIQFYKFDEISFEILFLGTCQETSYSICMVFDEILKPTISSYWLVKTFNQSTSIGLPHDIYWNPAETIFSIQKYNDKELSLFCHQLNMGLVTTALSDVNESINVIKRFQIGINYLRGLLLTRSFSKNYIRSIMKDIKSIIIFYGLRKRKNLYSNLFCTFSNVEYCNKFESKREKSKFQRKHQKKTSNKLIRLLLPLSKLSLLEKVTWLKQTDLIRFLTEAFQFYLPKKQKIILATYFLQNYFDEDNVFRSFPKKRKKENNYYIKLLVKKFEEISYGLILSIDLKNMKYLKNIHSLYQSNKQNNCFIKTKEKLFDTIKLSFRGQ